MKEKDRSARGRTDSSHTPAGSRSSTVSTSTGITAGDSVAASTANTHKFPDSTLNSSAGGSGINTSISPLSPSASVTAHKQLPHIDNGSEASSENLPIQNSIIAVVFSRIDLLLPYISGYSVSQVLAEPCYIQAKSHLLKLTSSPAYLHDIISCAYNLLIQILAKDSGRSQYERTANTLNSIYIIVQLLSNFITNMKAHENSNNSASGILKSVGLKINSFTLKDSHLTSKPSYAIDDVLATKVLRLLAALKSDNDCLSTLYSITDYPNSNASSNIANRNPNSGLNANINTHSSSKSLSTQHRPASVHNNAVSSSSSSSSTSSLPNSPMAQVQSSSFSFSSSASSSSNNANTPSSHSSSADNRFSSTMLDDHNEATKLLKKFSSMENSEMILMIDQAIFSVFLYLAASNPNEYLEFMKSVFRKIPLESLYIKGSYVIQFAFISSANFNGHIQFIRDLLYVTRRSPQRSLYLHYFSQAILSWAINRSEDFLKVVDSPICSKNAEVLFDTLYRQLDPKYCPKVYYSILSCLFLFQPKQITKFINDRSTKSTTQALKRSITSVTKLNSNRQKFLADFVLLVSKSPDFAQPLISFLLVGCSISTYSKAHPLYNFAIFMKDPLAAQVKLDSPEATYSQYSLSGSMPPLTSSSTNSSVTSGEPAKYGGAFESVTQTTNVIQDLKVGILAVSLVVNSYVLPDKILSALKSPKTAMISMALFTGAFRLLISVPSLSELTFKFIQDLSPTLIKVLSILCEVLTTPNKSLVSDNINDSLNLQLSSINISPISPSSNRTSSFSSADVARSSSTKSKSSSKRGRSTPGAPTSPGPNAPSSLFRASPLRLNYDDSRLDNYSIYSSDSTKSYDTDAPVPYFRATNEAYELKESINSSLLKRHVMQCHPALLKENVINLLMVYSSYPFLCYVDVKNEDLASAGYLTFEKNFKSFIEKIARLLFLEDDEIFSATESFLSSFCLTVSNVYPQRVFLAYIATAILIDSVSEVGISLTLSNEKRNRIIKLIFNLLETRAEHTNLNLLFNNGEMIKPFHLSGSCRRMVKHFERVIFIGLFSSNIETIRISKRLLQYYVFVITNKHHLPSCFDGSNLELANSILDDKMTFGLVTIRRKMRDRLCHIKKPTEMLLSVWSLMYEKVASAYDYEHGPNIDSTMEEIDSFFAHHQIIGEIEIYSEYLASLGGIILSDEFADDLRQPLLKKSLQQFLGNKFISLFSKDVDKREHSREILSVSIHPYLCELLLYYIKRVLPRFKANLDKSEYSICELFLSVLRSVCQVESDSLFSHAAELWDINFTLLKMLNIENNMPSFLRLKLKFCKLQTLFLSKLEELALNGNILNKNEYARVAADYLECSFVPESVSSFSQKKVLSFTSAKTDSSSSSKKMSSKLKEFKESELKDLHMDIKVEVSTMLKLIFYKLPLDTPRQHGGAEEDRSAENVIFSNYFNLFVRLLERLDEIKNEEDTYTPIAHRSSSIIKEIIQALINLLNANSNIGLKYSLPLGYHTDDLIRVSFIDVFSKIIKEIYCNYKKKISTATLYDQESEIFTSDFDLFLSAASCCPKAEIEAYAYAILQLPVNEKQKLKLLMSLIRFDVLQTSDKNEILRSNTVGTRVTALYSRDHATDYLKCIFKPIFQQMINNKEFFEIEKVGNKTDEEKAQNLRLFLKYLNMIADAINESISAMPIGIRLIAKVIFDATTEVMPEIKFTSLNAYLFLRLFNPTIVSPEHTDIVEFTDPLFKRSLIQLARVIQTIVNEAPVRIPLLETSVEALSYSKQKFFSFMKEVVNFHIEEAFNKIDSESENFNKFTDKLDKQDSSIYLHGFFYDNWMEIRRVYCSESFGYGTSKENKIKTIRTIDSILSNIGLPKRFKGYEIPESVKNDKSSKGILLYDFMSRTSLALQDVSFIKVLVTKDGLPLICVNTLDFPEDLTPEVYIYNLLQTLAKFWEAPFCVLIDLTAFKKFSIFEQGREIIQAIISTQYKINCKRVYYFNMSAAFFQRLKIFDLHFVNEDVTVNPEFIFLSTNDDDKVLGKNKLIGYTNAISNDSRVTFHDVSVYQEESKRFIPVKLKIGYHFLQICSALPQRHKIRNKMYIINLVDCYKISEIKDISLTTLTGIANEISMLDLETNKRIILASSKKIEIMRTMYFSRAILNNNSYTEDDYGVASNPKFTVGQFLNISFAGMLSKEGEIRKASYALLASVQHSVGLQTGKSIDSVDGVVFPYGNIDYVCSVSAGIAANHPTLTYAFIYGFFGAYNSLGEEDKNSLVLCVSPWVKNIYRYVYLSNSLLGPGRARDIIRKCVRASRKQKHFQVFSLFIWPQLSLQDGLIDIIIDEIVAASIDHEAEGNDWQRITKYWPLRSSIEICSVIIKRMKDKSYNMPLDESDIEAHTRWIETTVLARFLSYLIFDSLLFVDRYISDIFYIVTIYMDHGPLELRRCLIYLLARTFHSYLSKPTLTIEQHELIKNQIELLNGARFRMLFGLTRDDDEAFRHNRILGTDASSKANAIATLCDLLTSFLQSYLDSEEYELQMIKWNSSVCKLAFDDTAQLQSRAILIMGSLTKQGISSVLVLKFISLVRTKAIKIMGTGKLDPNSLKMIICTLHAFGKAIVGINEASIIHPLIFWFHINVLLSNDVSYFKYGTDFLCATLTNISAYLKDKDVTMVDYLFEHKKLISDLFEKTEQEFNFKLTRKNFDVVLTLIICKGLESPFSYNYATNTVKVLLKIRYEEYLRKSHREFNEFNCYVFFIFLTSNSNEEMIESIKYCGLGDIEYVTGVNNCKIPKILIEWFSTLTVNVYTTCLGAANYFLKQKLDELASTRVISLYVEIFQSNPRIILKLFRRVDGVLKKFIASSTTPNLLETVLDMVVTLMNDPEYASYQLSEEEWLKILEDNDVKGITNFTFNVDHSLFEPSEASLSEDKKRKLKNADNLLERIMELYKEESEGLV